jgi:hypothetical protein
MVFDGDRGKMTSKQWRSLPALSLRWVVMSSGGSGMARSGLDGGGSCSGGPPTSELSHEDLPRSSHSLPKLQS